MDSASLWKRYQQYLCHCPELGLWLDVSRMGVDDSFLQRVEPAMQQAFTEMQALESGVIANQDEKRMVGHYWLRDAELAPSRELQQEIEQTVQAVVRFAADIHNGTICSPAGSPFRKLLLIGIGGSALGPQFVADALGGPGDKMAPYFLDNTDPDGMDRVFQQIGELAECLVLVISKSGSTRKPATACWRPRLRGVKQVWISTVRPWPSQEQTASWIGWQ